MAPQRAQQGPVVVGVDGSAASLAGVAVAAREAALRGRRLALVHADSWTTQLAGSDGDPVELRADPEGILKEAVDYATGLSPARVTSEVVPGEPGAILAAQSRTADLVVVSHRGAGGFLGLRMGSVAIAVCAQARCPVLVVRGTPLPNGYVVVGVDGSTANRAAVGFAFAEAQVRGARLLAVHSRTGAEDPLAAMEPEWVRRYPTVPFELEVSRTRATGALVAASERAQLVVVGTRGHGRRPVLPFGSVTHALLHHSACPVAVVPPQR
jgi:nucleotide-binding universal stress UspA family protein